MTIIATILLGILGVILALLGSAAIIALILFVVIGVQALISVIKGVSPHVHREP